MVVAYRPREALRDAGRGDMGLTHQTSAGGNLAKMVPVENDVGERPYLATCAGGVVASVRR